MSVPAGHSSPRRPIPPGLLRDIAREIEVNDIPVDQIEGVWLSCYGAAEVWLSALGWQRLAAPHPGREGREERGCTLTAQGRSCTFLHALPPSSVPARGRAP